MKKGYYGCISCRTKLEYTPEKFTGTCNYHEGQYTSFKYCPNKECGRYGLYTYIDKWMEK